ncbi:hypothetical protein OOK13_40360 [Streptomyces sp. NBC_00378]|uniref:hypothetical protein n=1 Tax=unclassified Streptomyces TaxID=2593676 RepID=UPI002257BBE8|nr:MULTISPECIES: hypothetical protein [unclassified Streptomyces]MCX5112189.1 hypothetical protein [Streptomyces sp. NBC_00378]MCX5114616.1 hypothetical protein [Streptomyces sp. NBC_00378]
MSDREQLLHLADRARRGVALPAEHDALAAGIAAMANRLEDWKQAAGAGMTLADNLRAEVAALAPGVPLVCSDDRHKTKVFALEIRAAKAERAVDHLADRYRAAEARITTLEHVAAGNRQHVAAVVPELEKAEAALARVRAELHALASEVRGIGPIALAGRRDAVARIRAALDEQPTT